MRESLNVLMSNNDVMLWSNVSSAIDVDCVFVSTRVWK